MNILRIRDIASVQITNPPVGCRPATSFYIRLRHPFSSKPAAMPRLRMKKMFARRKQGIKGGVVALCENSLPLRAQVALGEKGGRPWARETVLFWREILRKISNNLLTIATVARSGNFPNHHWPLSVALLIISTIASDFPLAPLCYLLRYSLHFLLISSYIRNVLFILPPVIATSRHRDVRERVGLH